MAETNFVTLKNVRISFPHIWQKAEFDGEESGYGATLLLDKEDQAGVIEAIEKQIKTMIKEKLKLKSLPDEKVCLREGTDKREEYEGCMSLSANSRKRIPVINARGDGFVADEDDCKIYAGCYVNAKVSFWAQKNTYGKRINCQLVAVQFNGDGEAFSGAYVAPDVAIDGFGAATGTDDDDFLD